MKNAGLLTIFFALFLLSSCADKPARPDSLLTDAQKQAADAAFDAATAGGVQAAPLGAGGTIQHYYCANSCEGSGGDAQGNCPTCGEAYIHNAAFHNQTPTANPTTISSPPILGGDGATTINTPLTTPTAVPQATPPTPSPAQNANGVYHYTCPAGCAGGAGGAGNCSGCGGALAHNQEYHN